MPCFIQYSTNVSSSFLLPSQGERTVDKYLPDHLQRRNVYRMHIHIIPDDQHKYFKLVDQI